MKRIAEFLGLQRSLLGLLAMVVLVGMGEKMSERFLPMYLVALGSGLLWPGFLNALDNLLSALYSLPGGWLADRLGIRKSLLVFDLLAIAGFAVVAVQDSRQARNGLRLHARQRKPAMLYVMVMRVIPVHLWMVPSWKVIHIR